MAISSSGHPWQYIWDTTSKWIRTLTGHTEGTIAWCSVPMDEPLPAEVRTTLWDVHTGEHKLTLSGHDVHTAEQKQNRDKHAEDVYSVAFSPDGKTLASGHHDGTIRLWDADTGKHKAALSGHTWTVWSVTFSPDGKTLASGSGDKTIRLWDAATGKHQVAFTPSAGVVFSVVFSPDGKTFASGNDDDTIHLWDVDTRNRKRPHRNSTGLACRVQPGWANTGEWEWRRHSTSVETALILAEWLRNLTKILLHDTI